MQEIKNITAYRQQLRERIVVTAMHAFAKAGIKAVKMDDIAQELSISKRTLYEIYENKEVLLFEGVKRYKQQRRQEFEAKEKKGQNVMDIILTVYQQKVEELKLTNPLFYSDIKRYPNILAYLEADKEQALHQLTAFLERGAKEGFFRSDIDFELVAHLVNVIPQHIINNQLYKNYDAELILRNLVFFNIRGICTQRGIDVIDRFFDETA